MKNHVFLVPAIMASLFAMPPLSYSETIHYKLVKKIVLPTIDGHGDFLGFDPSNRMIYASMARSGGAVIDTNNNSIAHTVQGGIKNPAGNTWDHNYVYWTSNSKDKGKPNDRIFVVSKKTWSIVDQFKPVGISPDGIFADPVNKHLYIAMDDSNWVDVYSLGKNPHYIGKINLYPTTGSGPDVGTIRAKQDKLFMPDDSWEEEINLLNNQIIKKVNTLPLNEKLDNSHTKGQVYDPQTGDLWVGTTKNGVLVFNAKNMDLIKRIPSRGGIDEVALDPGYQLVYTFEGKAEGFNVYNAMTMKKLTFVKTGYTSTHTGAVNPFTHAVYAYAGMDHAIFVYQPIVTPKK